MLHTKMLRTTTASQMLTGGRTDGQMDWVIAIALSQIGWMGAKNYFQKFVPDFSRFAFDTCLVFFCTNV